MRELISRSSESLTIYRFSKVRGSVRRDEEMLEEQGVGGVARRRSNGQGTRSSRGGGYARESIE